MIQDPRLISDRIRVTKVYKGLIIMSDVKHKYRLKTTDTELRM
jgi:hypothetical protein